MTFVVQEEEDAEQTLADARVAFQRCVSKCLSLPPPEPHDVRAHLQGGVPLTEIDSQENYWQNYEGLREDLFAPRDADYMDFAQALTNNLSDCILLCLHQSLLHAGSLTHCFGKQITALYGNNFGICGSSENQCRK